MHRKQLKKRISKNRSVKKGLYVSFIFSISLPIILFMFVVYAYITRDINIKNELMLRTMTENTCNRIDNEFSQINKYVVSLSVTQWMQQLMFSKQDIFSRFDPYEIQNYNQQFLVSSLLNHLIKNFVVVLNQRDLVFANGNQMASIETYMSATFNLTDKELADLENKINTYTNGVFVYPVKRKYSNQNDLLYIKTISGYDDKLIRGTFVCTIDQEYLKTILRDMMFDQNGKGIIAFQNQLIIGDEALWISIQKNGQFKEISEKEIHQIQIDKDKYRVFAMPSTTGLCIYMFVDQSPVFVANYTMFAIVSVAFIALLGCSMIVARYIANRNYNSLGSLINILKTRKQENIHFKEVEYQNIFDTYMDMLYLNQAQSITISKQKQILYEYWWRMLLENNDWEKDDVLNISEIIIPTLKLQSHFCCVFIDEGHCQAAKILIEKLKQMKDADGTSIHYREHTCLVISLYNTRSEEQIHNLIIETIKTENLNTVCGIGRCYYDAKDIGQSYNEALLTANYQMNNNGSHVFIFGCQSQKISYFCYTMNQESRLANLLKTGSYDQVIKAVDELMAVNININTIPTDAITNFLFTVYLTGIRVLGELELQIDPEYRPSDLLAMHNVDKIRKIVLDFFEKICCNVLMDERANASDYFKNIQQFIQSNLTNPSLSMQMISDYIQRSTSYTSRLFSRVFKTPFVDYVNQRRVEMAAAMLTQTDLPMNEISVRVGFASIITFRRSFMKYIGINPGIYRSKTRKESNHA